MKTILTTAAVLIALADVSAAQPVVTTQMAEQLVYRTQAIRDRIGVQCNLKLSGRQRDECEVGVYTTYYGIVDSIRAAERISGDEALKSITQKIDEFDVKAAPHFKSLER